MTENKHKKGFTRLVDFGDAILSRPRRASPKFTAGFTLIEVVIYIGLFSLLIGTAFTAAYGLIESSERQAERNTTIAEGSFVLRKISWAMRQDAAKRPVIKYDAENSRILLEEADGSPVPITTNNVKVSAFQFQSIPDPAAGPGSFSVSFTMDGTDFRITSYLPQ